MPDSYILGIDQSTSGTKALLFDSAGDIIARHDVPHRQIISDDGWISHDPTEIYENTLEAVKRVVTDSGIDKRHIAGAGISNQRETAVVWDKNTGEPINLAVVWQCARGEEICGRVSKAGHAEKIKAVTGLHLSPYFSAAKIKWILENSDISGKNLCAGTIDAWLVFKLTGNHKTDFSNASRTQLFDIKTLDWSKEACGAFGIDPSILPEPCYSDSLFGLTDFGGFLDSPVPVHGVLGDSHGALFGQGCLDAGMIKATYGTGSSVMMNTGKTPVFCENGLVTSIAWGMGGDVSYVLEGNINYTGAVMKWIVEDLGIMESPKLASEFAEKANPSDKTYLVPAFSGLGAPYWNSGARAILCGMTRSTGKHEIVKAAEECIGYQIADVIGAMREASGIAVDSLRVDGGPTRDRYLMQFQCDILDLPVFVPSREELSGIGAAYTAGIALGVYDKDAVLSKIKRTCFVSSMSAEVRAAKIAGWRAAIKAAIESPIDE